MCSLISWCIGLRRRRSHRKVSTCSPTFQRSAVLIHSPAARMQAEEKEASSTLILLDIYSHAHPENKVAQNLQQHRSGWPKQTKTNFSAASLIRNSSLLRRGSNRLPVMTFTERVLSSKQMEQNAHSLCWKAPRAFFSGDTGGQRRRRRDRRLLRPPGLRPRRQIQPRKCSKAGMELIADEEQLGAAGGGVTGRQQQAGWAHWDTGSVSFTTVVSFRVFSLF